MVMYFRWYDPNQGHSFQVFSIIGPCNPATKLISLIMSRRKLTKRKPQCEHASVLILSILLVMCCGNRLDNSTGQSRYFYVHTSPRHKSALESCLNVFHNCMLCYLGQLLSRDRGFFMTEVEFPKAFQPF